MHLTSQRSERPPAARLRSAWLQPLHCGSHSLSVAVAHFHLVRRSFYMESKDQPTEDEFFLLGSYSPHEAAKLLECFEKDGIVFRAQTVRHSYHPRMTVAISVDPQRA